MKRPASKGDVRRGLGYTRVSSKAQAEVQHGSLEQQAHMLERWIQQYSERTGTKYQITRIIQEDISGRESSLHKRTGYQEMIVAIKSRLIDFIITEKIDRFGRSKIAVQRLVELALKNNVEVFEVESGKINLRDRGNRLSFNIKNIFSEEYSLELEEKVTKKQREARMNNGKDTSTYPVLGLDPHPSKRGFYVINTTEQVAVIEIFETFLRLGSLKALSDYCATKDYKTKVRSTKEKTDRDGTIIPSRQVGGQPLIAKRLFYLLTNPKYRGSGTFEDTWNQFPEKQDESSRVTYEYAHGPVIPVDLFDKVQALLKQNALTYRRGPGKSAVYLLSGILQLPDGRRFYGASAKSGKVRYYLCKGINIRLRKEKVEEAVCQRVKIYLQESGTLEKVLSAALRNRLTGLPLIDEQISECRTTIGQLERVVDGFAQALRKAAIEDPAALVRVTATLNSEKEKAESDLMRTKKQLEHLLRKKDQVTSKFQEKTIQEYLTRALEKFDQKPDLEKKRIVQTIIPEVIFHPDNRLELKVNPDPNGCHREETKVRVSENWRARTVTEL